MSKIFHQRRRVKKPYLSTEQITRRGIYKCSNYQTRLRPAGYSKTILKFLHCFGSLETRLPSFESCGRAGLESIRKFIYTIVQSRLQ